MMSVPLGNTFCLRLIGRARLSEEMKAEEEIMSTKCIVGAYFEFNLYLYVGDMKFYFRLADF